MSNQKLEVNAATGEAVTRDMTPEEQADHDAREAAWIAGEPARERAEVEAARRADYEAISDPLFFEWQRGDGTEQAWLDAVAAVKAAHPYPPAP
jgi:hypothetical protein